jgi:hypothetical protein
MRHYSLVMIELTVIPPGWKEIEASRDRTCSSVKDIVGSINLLKQGHRDLEKYPALDRGHLSHGLDFISGNSRAFDSFYPYHRGKRPDTTESVPVFDLVRINSHEFSLIGRNYAGSVLHRGEFRGYDTFKLDSSKAEEILELDLKYQELYLQGFPEVWKKRTKPEHLLQRISWSHSDLFRLSQENFPDFFDLNNPRYDTDIYGLILICGIYNSFGDVREDGFDKGLRYFNLTKAMYEFGIESWNKYLNGKFVEE